MRANKIHLLVITCVMCVIVECNGTNLSRVTRTLPFDLFPSRWQGALQNFLPGGRFWEWPRSSAISLLRLVASPDTRKTLTFNFRPDDGIRASYAYQQRYGYRGQWLIDLLGAGYDPDGPHYQQRLPVFVLTPPPPPT